jgi:hypothetical protein
VYLTQAGRRDSKSLINIQHGEVFGKKEERFSGRINGSDNYCCGVLNSSGWKDVFFQRGWGLCVSLQHVIISQMIN